MWSDIFPEIGLWLSSEVPAFGIAVRIFAPTPESALINPSVFLPVLDEPPSVPHAFPAVHRKPVPADTSVSLFADSRSASADSETLCSAPVPAASTSPVSLRLVAAPCHSPLLSEAFAESDSAPALFSLFLPHPTAFSTACSASDAAAVLSHVGCRSLLQDDRNADFWITGEMR